MKHALTSASISIGLAFAAPSALACDFDDADGPDVALVLSGGGALTGTQIGVMQIIEEVGVPIHCVLGTSMGSVTGAMYVAGYDAEEIATLYRERPWGEIFRGRVTRDDQPFLQKDGYDAYFGEYFAGIDSNGLRLPGGLASMNGLQATFREMFDHIPNESDFTQDFRVPYRSVAMNLSTGEAVAFENGDLVQTILASMAVPGVFAPRDIEDDLYVDGGMAAQLPVRFAKDMGADIIIAVDTTVEPSRVEGSPSVTSTTNQLIQITVYRNTLTDIALLGEDDLLISPDLTGLSSSDFTLIDEGVASGRAEAERFRQRLEEIAAAAAPARDRSISPYDAPSTAASPILLANETEIDDNLIIERLALDEGETPDRETIKRRLRSLSSFGAFGDVDLARSLDGQLLRIEPRPIGRNLLQAGFRASTTFDRDAYYALLARLSRRPVNSRGGEASLSLEIGTNLGATFEYLQPFGSEGRYFVSPIVSLRGEEVLFDLGDERLGEFWEQRADARVRLGRELGDWGVIAAEVITSVGEIDTVVTSRPSLTSGASYDLVGGGVYFGIDTLNRTTWPTRGLQLLASGELLYDWDTEAEARRYNLSATQTAEFGPVGLNLRLQAEGVEDDADRPTQILSLGGFRRISAFAEDSLPTDQYVLATADVFYRVTGSEAILNVPFYVGGTLEYAVVSFDLYENPVFGFDAEAEGRDDEGFAGSLYLGSDTPIGPIYLGYGASEFGDTALFLHIGRVF